QQEQEEVHRLHDERPVETDQPTAPVVLTGRGLGSRGMRVLGAGGERRADQDPGDQERRQQPADPNASVVVHEEVSPSRGSLRPGVVKTITRRKRRQSKVRSRAMTPPPTTRSP